MSRTTRKRFPCSSFPSSLFKRNSNKFKNMENGWIKIHRSLLTWEWYDEPNTFRLFIHCILMANHKDKKYRGQLVEAGSFLTGRELLAKQTGLSVQSLRTCLSRLESTNELTIKTTPKGTVIQVVNYKKYQLLTSESTNNQPTTNQQLTTNNNDKNNKEDIYREFSHLKLSVKDFEKLKANYSKQQIDQVLDSIENYKQNKRYKSLYLTAKNWLKNDSKNNSTDDYVKNVLNQIKQ